MKRSTPLLPTSIATEEGVYGIILVSGLVAAAGTAEMGSLHTLIFVGVTLIVFWVAHIYAGTVAIHGSGEDEVVGLREAIQHSVKRSRGLLVSGLIPAVPLLLGTFGIIGDKLAAWVALWVGTAVLALLGYAAYRRKNAPLHLRLIGAFCTASFGLIIIVVKAIVQH